MKLTKLQHDTVTTSNTHSLLMLNSVRDTIHMEDTISLFCKIQSISLGIHTSSLLLSPKDWRTQAGGEFQNLLLNRDLILPPGYHTLGLKTSLPFSFLFPSPAFQFIFLYLTPLDYKLLEGKGSLSFCLLASPVLRTEPGKQPFNEH